MVVHITDFQHLSSYNYDSTTLEQEHRKGQLHSSPGDGGSGQESVDWTRPIETPASSL